MYTILNKLSQTIFMDINTTGLSMMNFTLHHGRICTGLNLKTGYAIVVNVILFKVALLENNT
jgi:hypothetical protein